MTAPTDNRPPEKKTGPEAFERYRKFRRSAFYFVYDHRNPHTEKLLDSNSDYGVVQLQCVDNEVRAAFLAGYRAGKRHAK